MPHQKKPKTKAPPPVASEPSGFYVKVPIPPELAEALGGHVERARAIAKDLLDVVQRIASEHAAATRTVRKLRGPRRRR